MLAPTSIPGGESTPGRPAALCTASSSSGNVVARQCEGGRTRAGGSEGSTSRFYGRRQRAGGGGGGQQVDNAKTQGKNGCVMCVRLWETIVLFAWLIKLSATSQQYFSLTTNQPAATSQQYSSIRTDQHQPSATSQRNRLDGRL
jgi:hypothetical protein